MLHRREEHDGVVHRAADHAADQKPQKGGQIAELGGQDRTDQRAGGGDRREVLTEVDPLLGRHIVLAVLKLVGWGDLSVVSAKHLANKEHAIEAVADHKYAQRGDHKRYCVIHGWRSNRN